MTQMTWRLLDGRTFQHEVPDPLPPTFEMEEVPDDLVVFESKDESLVLHEPGALRYFRLEAVGDIPLAYVEVRNSRRLR